MSGTDFVTDRMVMVANIRCPVLIVVDTSAMLGTGLLSYTVSSTDFVVPTFAMSGIDIPHGEPRSRQPW
eukprot:1665816-Rhodomonas_salina.1